MYRPAIFAQGTAQVLLVVLVLSLPVSPVDSSERKPGRLVSEVGRGDWHCGSAQLHTAPLTCALL